MADREERVRQRAHEIWQREGGSHGRHDEHWHQAQREIEAEDAVVGEAPTLKDVKEKAAKKSAKGAGAKVEEMAGALSSPDQDEAVREADAVVASTAGRRTKARIEAAAAPATDGAQSPTPSPKPRARAKTATNPAGTAKASPGQAAESPTPARAASKGKPPKPA